MKRFLCLTLAVLLALCLLACGGSGEKEETAEAPAWEGKFAVGYGRADVTPDYSVGMRGYGDVRMSVGVLNKLYITCIAVTDETGNTVLLFAYDCKNMKETDALPMRKAVSAATGIAVENIFINCTHSHSTPDLIEPFLTFANECAVTAAQAALADRAAATMEYGSSIVENMTFVRHYKTKNGMVAGDNFNPEGAGAWIEHTTEADEEMRVIRVNREGKKPVLLVNWQGHPTIASSSWTEFGKLHRDYMTSDYVGACRDYVEAQMDCDFAMFLGAGGNLNVTGALAGENKTTNTTEYAQKLGDAVLATLENMTAATTDKISMATAKFDTGEVPIDINAIGLGSIAFVTAPCEMFDTTSMAIREKSPFASTFVLSLTNGSVGYLPTEDCFRYPDCYEVKAGGFYEGAAEKIVDVYAELLTQANG